MAELDDDLEIDDGLEESIEEGPEDDAVEDDSVDGGEGEDEADGGEEDGSDEDEGQGRRDAPVAKRGRAAERISRQNEVVREARAQAARMQERVDRLEREAGERNSARSQEEENNRVALMSEPERIDHYRQKDRAEMQRELFGLKFQMADTSDKTSFESKAARVPAFAKVQDEVEQILADERRQGRNPTRENIATHLIGKMAIERATRANGKQGKAAAAGRQRQAARPTGARSDVSSDRRQTGGADARKKRLENMLI